MTNSNRAYRAVCFDLDGTLLQMDLDYFMTSYFSAIERFVTAHGLDGEAFLTAMRAGTSAIVKHTDERTNEEAFWDDFFRHMDRDAANWDVLLGEFYQNEFDRIGKDVVPNEFTVNAVETLHAKGYPLVLATMPMFPPAAVRRRLRWAGIDPEMFSRITTYDNSRSIKPRPNYYAENLAALGVRGHDVLMVGNNTIEDGSFSELGADMYFISDCLLDPAESDLSQLHLGTAEEFAAWVKTLPICENPARNIDAGLIGKEARDKALADNSKEADDDQAALSAKFAAMGKMYGEADW